MLVNHDLIDFVPGRNKHCFGFWNIYYHIINFTPSHKVFQINVKQFVRLRIEESDDDRVASSANRSKMQNCNAKGKSFTYRTVRDLEQSLVELLPLVLRVRIIFQKIYKSMGIFPDDQGQLTPQSLVQSGRISILFEMLCMCLLPARIKKIQSKMKALVLTTFSPL